jgi:hypothetical protein
MSILDIGDDVLEYIMECLDPDTFFKLRMVNRKLYELSKYYNIRLKESTIHVQSCEIIIYNTRDGFVRSNAQRHYHDFDGKVYSYSGFHGTSVIRRSNSTEILAVEKWQYGGMLHEVLVNPLNLSQTMKIHEHNIPQGYEWMKQYRYRLELCNGYITMFMPIYEYKNTMLIVKYASQYYSGWQRWILGDFFSEFSKAHILINSRKVATIYRSYKIPHGMTIEHKLVPNKEHQYICNISCYDNGQFDGIQIGYYSDGSIACFEKRLYGGPSKTHHIEKRKETVIMSSSVAEYIAWD